MKLFVTLDTINEDEDITCLLGCILECIKEHNTDVSSIDTSVIKGDVFDALASMRMEYYYTEETINQCLFYMLNFIEQKKKQNEISISLLKDYRVSLNTLNRICVIMRFLIKEKKI